MKKIHDPFSYISELNDYGKMPNKQYLFDWGRTDDNTLIIATFKDMDDEEISIKHILAFDIEYDENDENTVVNVVKNPFKQSSFDSVNGLTLYEVTSTEVIKIAQMLKEKNNMFFQKLTEKLGWD